MPNNSVDFHGWQHQLAYSKVLHKYVPTLIPSNPKNVGALLQYCCRQLLLVRVMSMLYLRTLSRVLSDRIDARRQKMEGCLLLTRYQLFEKMVDTHIHTVSARDDYN